MKLPCLLQTSSLIAISTTESLILIAPSYMLGISRFISALDGECWLPKSTVKYSDFRELIPATEYIVRRIDKPNG